MDETDNPETRTVRDLLSAPCLFCGYNGAGYWQAGMHAEECPWHVIAGSYERAYCFRDEVVGIWDQLAERKMFRDLTSDERESGGGQCEDCGKPLDEEDEYRCDECEACLCVDCFDQHICFVDKASKQGESNG